MTAKVPDTGGIVLRPAPPRRRYRARRHPASGLPVMVAVERTARKVTAAEIARLNAERPAASLIS